MRTNSATNSYRLLSCIWELTLKCTMNCLHCGSVAGKARKYELTLDECIGVADQLIDLGCRELSFIGGEVFLYLRWEEVARYLSDAGVLVNIMTNGYRLSDEHLRQIKHARLSNVGVSIDGMEANHNRIRGKMDGFAEAARSLNLMNQENVPTGVVTVLLDFNCADLEDMYVFLVNKGVKVWQLQLANPMGNLADEAGMIVDPLKIPTITGFIREKNQERRMVVIGADSVGYHDDNEKYLRGRRFAISCWNGCQAGITGIAIDSIGNVKGCGALYSDVFIEGNVRERSLAEIWHDPSRFSYNRDFTYELLSGKCESCEVGNICRGGCRASNYFAGGSLYESQFCSRHQGIAAQTEGAL